MSAYRRRNEMGETMTELKAGVSHVALATGCTTGGVGKTTVFLTMAESMKLQGVDVALGEMDDSQNASLFLGDGIAYRAAGKAAVKEAESDPSAVVKHGDGLYGFWASHPVTLTDTGAAVDGFIDEYMSVSELPEIMRENGMEYWPLLVASPNLIALEHVHASLKAKVRLFGSSLKAAVVLNDNKGREGFAPYESEPAFREVMAICDRLGLPVVRVPHCSSELVTAYGNAKHIPPLRLHHLLKGHEQAKANAAKVMATLGMTEPHFRREMAKLSGWVAASVAALDPVWKSALGMEG